jgi:hypothetical protein
MVSLMENKDEPYVVAEASDNQFNRIYWVLRTCPDAGACKAASFKKAFIRSFISRNRLIDYLALHLNRSSHHHMNQQQSYDLAKDWVGLDANVEECTETFADRQEYREQIMRARRQAMHPAQLGRTPSRGREASVKNRERSRSPRRERSRTIERRVGNSPIELRPPRGPPPDIDTLGPSQNIAIGRDDSRTAWPPLPPSGPPPDNVINTLVSGAALVIGSIGSRRAPTAQTASSFGGSAGSAGDSVDRSQLQLLHDVLTRAHGALNAASKACESLRRTFHDEAEVINEARAALKTIMER